MKVSPVKCKDSPENVSSLSRYREYEVLGIEAHAFRILSDPESKPHGNAPVLYDAVCFKVIDPQEPDFWICQYDEDGGRYCYPPEWNEVGFFENYQNGKAQVRERFWNTLKHYYPETWNERKGLTDIGFKRSPGGGP